MKKITYTLLLLIGGMPAMAETHSICSPDGKLTVSIDDANNQLTYSVNYEGKEMLCPSLLGIKTEMGDYTRDVKLTGSKERKV